MRTTIPKLLPLALAMAALGGAGAAQAQTYYHYDCTDGANFEIGLYPDTKAAFLQIDGKSLMLPKRVWVNGARYSRSGVSLVLKGNNATIKHAGKTSRCTVK